MVTIDQVVLLVVLLGTAVCGGTLWRRGARGWRFARATWLAFYALALIAMMGAHSGEILYHTLRGDTAFDGSVWTYNFRVYALHLLGAVLIWQGAVCLRAAFRIGQGDWLARREALRAVLIVLAIVLPLVPIHAFFGVILTVLSAVSLLAVISALGVRASRPVAV